MSLRVLGDRVLVALPPDPAEVTTDAGLVVLRDPDVMRKASRGIVMAVGEKTLTVDRQAVRALVHTAFVEADVPGAVLEAEAVRVLGDAIDRALERLAPAPFDVQVGDCVLFHPRAGDQFEDDGVTYVVLREAEIIGIVPETEAA